MRPTIRVGATATGDDGRVPGAPHPRIRDRRRAVRRDEGRRRLRRLLVLLGLSAVVLAIGAILTSPLADIDEIRVSASSPISEGEIIEASGLSPGDALIDVDGAAVADRVRALARVADTEVERHWPGTVVIRVAEREPVAVLDGSDGNGPLVVGARGHVLGPPASPVPDLPHLAVPATQVGERLGPPGRAAVGVVARLPSSVGAEVAELRAEADRARDGEIAVTLVLRDGVEVKVGSPVRVPAKLAALDAMLLGADRSGAATIDVRVPSAPVLTNHTEGA